MVANPKRPKPLRDKAYRLAVTEMPCILTGTMPCDPAHIRYGFFAKGVKPGDDLILPLSANLHRLQHAIGEKRFWLTHVTPETLMEAIKALARERYATWKLANT